MGGLPARNDASNLERTSYHDSRLTAHERFTSVSLIRLLSLDWDPNCGDNINQTVLSSATGLESPKSLASDRASSSDSFSSIGQVAFTSPSLCASMVVFFSIFKVTLFSHDVE